ncbi:MAG TPA: universal stress protein [Gemmatimonadota bacterium]|jgi:nucleotide-binding universal stress UspA family protein
MTWKKVLVATDFSAPARVALRSAQALVAAAGGTIQLVHVLSPLPPRYKLLIGSFGVPDLDRERLTVAEREMERLCRRVRSGRTAIEGFVRSGVPWREILGATEECESELVCLGNSGHSRLERLLLGSTAENVVRRSAIPVLITRRAALRSIERVLLPVDLGPASERAIRFALERLPRKARLDAFFVVPPPPPLDPLMMNLVADPKALETELRTWLARIGATRVKPAVRVLGDPAHEILQRARRSRADLIVISTHGRQGLAHLFLGSVAEKVVRYAERPVLVLPGPGRERR